jgi:hypothetical protein
VTGKADIYSILRPLLKQTVSYTYYRGADVLTSGAGWVERLVLDRPEVASYFTPLSICLNLDSFDYLEFDTNQDQLLIYSLVLGSERVVIEYATGRPPLEDGDELLPLRRVDTPVADGGYVQMELLARQDDHAEERTDDEEAG